MRINGASAGRRARLIRRNVLKGLSVSTNIPVEGVGVGGVVGEGVLSRREVRVRIRERDREREKERKPCFK